MRAVLVGEGMLELSRQDAGWRLGHGGDTLNTAIHLARAGVAAAYLTALGADPFSADLKASWAGEGLDTSLILTDPARNPGLYAIRTGPDGERSFTYWRNDSAARHLFSCDGIARAIEAAAQADLLAFSLITLAVLPARGRERLLALALRVRERGGTVAFDGNYRPRLWESADAARLWSDTAIGCSSIGLPTLDDETLLRGEQDMAAVVARWQGLGCAETVLKLGPQGCRLPDGRIIPPARTLKPVDTSGAGDAFNAGYLAARLGGDDMEAAAHAGNALAGWTILRPGAIPPRDS